MHQRNEKPTFSKVLRRLTKKPFTACFVKKWPFWKKRWLNCPASSVSRKTRAFWKSPSPPLYLRVPILSEETSMKQMSSTAVVAQEALLLPTPSFEARKCRARREVDDNLLASGFSIINLCSALAGTLCFPRELGGNSFKKFWMTHISFVKSIVQCAISTKTYQSSHDDNLLIFKRLSNCKDIPIFYRLNNTVVGENASSHEELRKTLNRCVPHFLLTESSVSQVFRHQGLAFPFSAAFSFTSSSSSSSRLKLIRH